MRTQGILTSLGTFLTTRLSAREKGGETHVAREKRGDAPTTPGVVTGNADDAVTAEASQSATVHRRPVLALLPTVRNRQTSNHCLRWRELSLPPGCILAVCYTSR